MCLINEECLMGAGVIVRVYEKKMLAIRAKRGPEHLRKAFKQVMKNDTSPPNFKLDLH